MSYRYMRVMVFFDLPVITSANKPADGLVQVLKITEKQFGKMEFIVGTKKSEILDSDERVVII